MPPSASQDKATMQASANNSSDTLFLKPNSTDNEQKRPRRLAIDQHEITALRNLEPSSSLNQPVLRLIVRLDHSWKYQSCLLFAILYGFLADDVRIICLPVAADPYIDCSILVVVAFFIWDCGMQVAWRPDYLWSLFFFLDVLATATLLGNVNWLFIAVSDCAGLSLGTHKIIGSAARLGGNSLRLLHHLHPKSSKFLSQLSTPSSYPISPRTPFIPSNQIVPEMQISGGFPSPEQGRSPREDKSAEIPKRKKKRNDTLGRLYGSLPTPHMQPESTPPPPPESQLSKRLSTRTVQLVSLTVISIILVYVWISDISAIYRLDTSYDYGIKLLDEASNTPKFEEMVVEFMLGSEQSQGLDRVVQLQIGSYQWGQVKDSVRSSELCQVAYGEAVAHVNYSNRARLQSIFTLCKTFFLCVFMVSTILTLNSDFNNLLVFPLERMMETVAVLSQNPLNMFKAEYQTKTFEMGKKRRWWGVGKDYARAEIRILENAFCKIGVMLALVYGSAGSEMITSSLRSDTGFTPIIRGREILAIFCFAKIGSFPDLLDTLGPNVLKYMHLVSRLVHSQSEKYNGCVNRNLGDSYLLVWKFPDEDVVVVRRKFVVNAHSDHVRQTTSLALLSAIKSIYKVVKSSALRPYYQDSELHALTGSLHPELTFGFHVGWAYEGPIGSMFKIDASYLSPNVNIASRVESACKQYGVKVLCSEEFVVRLDSTVQTYLRHIDTVTLKGVHLPLELHCFDLDTSGLVKLSRAKPTKHRIERQRRKLQAAMDNGLFRVQALFTISEDLSLMRQPYTAAFLRSFGEAVKMYLAGDWMKVREGLEAALESRPGDGPSRNLWEFLQSGGWVAPKEWQGFRELHEK